MSDNVRDGKNDPVKDLVKEKEGRGTRRRLLGVMGGALATLGVAGAARAQGGAPADDAHRRRHGARHQVMREVIARQQIMELRHAYGIATDLIGKNTPDEIEAGRAIYRRIFTADASIGAAGVESVKGPDAWVDIVKEALAPYNATQHLIGTQHITGLVLPDRAGAGGAAHMSSYLQAWHSKADGHLWLFMGTYEDDLVWTEANGWQIRAMILKQVAADYRELGKRPD